MLLLLGVKNVNFLSVIVTNEIDEVERILKKEFERFRVRKPISNRKTEWLIDTTKDKVLEIIITNLRQTNISYTLYDSIELE